MPILCTLPDWLARLEQAHPSTIELGLERVAQVRDALNLLPDFPVILVGGTNGKGSTCATLESILRAQGYKTGLYVSPHLIRYNERIRVNGEEASDEAIVAGLEAVEQARLGVSLTYFEHGTLGAVWQFMQAGVDVAILEVGLGGRLDAVNIFEPVISIVTTVDLDHQDWLGSTREAIGFEKAGIFRSGKPAVCADRDPPASLLNHADTLGTRLLCIGRDFDFQTGDHEWSLRIGDTEFPHLPPPVLEGWHQYSNAAAAIAALVTVSDTLPVTPEAVARGLRKVAVPGRFQRIMLEGGVELVMDVAHNPEAARALAANLMAHPVNGRTLAVVSILADKDTAGVVAPLKPMVSDWLPGGLEGPRGQSAEQLARHFQAMGVEAMQTCSSVVEAFVAARKQAVEGDRIVVFGSFHTVAEILTHATTR